MLRDQKFRTCATKICQSCSSRNISKNEANLLAKDKVNISHINSSILRCKYHIQSVVAFSKLTKCAFVDICKKWKSCSLTWPANPRVLSHQDASWTVGGQFIFILLEERYHHHHHHHHHHGHRAYLILLPFPPSTVTRPRSWVTQLLQERLIKYPTLCQHHRHNSH